MRRVKIHAFCLTLLAFAAFAPSANAAVADHIIPLYDASDGVRPVQKSTGEVVLHFGPKAAKLYKTIGGKRVTLACGTVTGEPDGDGFFSTGHGESTDTLPKRRGAVRMYESNPDLELCAIASKRVKADRTCFPLTEDSKLCTRVIVAVRPSGLAYIQARARTVELSLTVLTLGMADSPALKVPGATRLEKMQRMLGPDVVELTTPDDTPPAGKVGYWTDGKNLAAVALLADGTRRFVRFQDEVYSTNDPALMGLDNDAVFTVF
ncbi:hypothetical protein OJ998_14775 [Solirubrobacter taibaiensis]|nr:hypothetical protein [Solirubrobacter taibaiensis]